ncbi:phosphoribosyltransferase [Prosthecomicrobium sp. N25]|uniref:phosphoribosyltransferase n=1 Tax=Prosthecomicrobium sp. N25 TaxID=3129254 RepID=UPI003076D45F
MSDLLPHQYWQTLEPRGTPTGVPEGGHRDGFPALLPDGRVLRLPIRVLPGDGTRAVASLIVNQASFAVEDALADGMAELARGFDPAVIVGVPTLGLPLAAGVARRLGHGRMVALGTSRKFWYRDDLSVPLASITTPGSAKRLYLDPRMLPVLEGRRVVVVDDVVSSGSSMEAVLTLLGAAGLAPLAVVAAMLQTRRWVDRLAGVFPEPAARILGVMATPFLVRGRDGGWRPEA